MEASFEHRVVYIHGRPSGHPIHNRYASELGADFVPVDVYIPWHANPNPGKLRKYASWLVCALFFPKAKKYDVFFTESVREPLLIRKLIGLFGKRQKLIPLMANETLFFYHNNMYSAPVMRMIKSYLAKSDAIICVGKFQTEMAVRIIGEEKKHKVKTITNWIFKEKSNELLNLKPNLSTRRILFIGDVSADFRAWYKGVDLIINAFNIAATKNTDLILEMVGINNPELLDKYLSDIPAGIKSRIIIHKRMPVIPYLQSAALYLHCARGEAWGISIMEALQAGVPVICSDCTGAKEVVEKVVPEFVVENEINTIAERILYYFNLPLSEKEKLSEKGREIMKEYTEEKCLTLFHKVFQETIDELYKVDRDQV